MCPTWTLTASNRVAETRRDPRASKREPEVLRAAPAVKAPRGSPALSVREAALASYTIGIAPHLLLPAFDLRCQTVPRPTPAMSSGQSPQPRRKFAQLRRFQSHDDINRERKPRRADRHAHTTGRVAAGMGAAHEKLLVKEKAQTRARDALAAERRRMPWMAVEKAYAFEGPAGKASLPDLFDGRRQLIVYRAFFEPGVFGWPEHACRGCSMVADQVAHVAHLNARDTTLVFVSRAPQPDIARLKARMGWEIPWFTLTDRFDADFGVDEWHGTNVFYRDGERVFRTYFTNNRGDEQMGSTWNYLDITPLGRQEVWEDSPEGYPQTPTYKWWNWHDSYVADAAPDKKWVEVSDAGEAAFRNQSPGTKP